MAHPLGLDVNAVGKSMTAVAGVKCVHDLHDAYPIEHVTLQPEPLAAPLVRR